MNGDNDDDDDDGECVRGSRLLHSGLSVEPVSNRDIIHRDFPRDEIASVNFRDRASHLQGPSSATKFHESASTR